MLPFETRIELPRSAICEFGNALVEGHRVKITTTRNGKARHQYCGKCKRRIEHDAAIGTYVTPFVIQEVPF